MTDLNVNEIIRTTLQAQIMLALKSAPEAIEKLVEAAISEPVDAHSGDANGYSGNRVPYLTYIVGKAIQDAARAAVAETIAERLDEIHAAVRRRLSADDMVDAVMKATLGELKNDYRLLVSFASTKKDF